MKRITILSGLIALISLTSCNSKQEEKEVQKRVTNPITIDTSFTKICFSNRSIKNIEIRALEKGSCKKIYVDEGQYVKRVSYCSKYCPFMRLNIKSNRRSKGCRDRSTKHQGLSDKNVVSKNELAVARARLDQAKKEMAMAKFHLSATNIKAHFLDH
jgi:membrane fusion protein (multidrug efflux system)